MENDMVEILPRRLVFITLGKNCMFCPDPQGESYITSVDFESKLGYISCNACRGKMHFAADFWKKHRAYGAANHLKDRTDLKIKRSNGDMEDGWSLNNPVVNKEEDGRVTIRCYNDSQQIEKWCYIDNLLEWNPT